MDNGLTCLHMSIKKAAASFDSTLERERLRYFPRRLATATPVRLKNAIHAVTPFPLVSISVQQLL